MRIGNSENGEVAAREVCGSVVLSSPLLSNTEEMTAVLEVLQVSYYVGPTTPTRLVAGAKDRNGKCRLRSCGHFWKLSQTWGHCSRNLKGGYDL